MGIVLFMIENNEIFISISYEKDEFRGVLTAFLKLDNISGSKTQILKNNFERNIGEFYKEYNDSTKTRILYKYLFDFIRQNPTLELSGEFLLKSSNTNDYLSSKQILSLLQLLDTSYQSKKN